MDTGVGVRKNEAIKKWGFRNHSYRRTVAIRLEKSESFGCGEAVEAFSRFPQGVLQGNAGCLKGIASVVAPLLMAQSFTAFTGKTAPFCFPGMSFVIAAVAVLASLLFIYLNQPE